MQSMQKSHGHTATQFKYSDITSFKKDESNQLLADFQFDMNALEYNDSSSDEERMLELDKAKDIGYAFNQFLTVNQQEDRFKHPVHQFYKDWQF